jgi:NAD(P)-dependent dehydrogenase (short-subunit alcohol dehydrogenase family)/acyl dehydratase
LRITLPVPDTAQTLDFAAADLLAFAEASGDRNSLHIDAGFARRTPFGGPIVHGSLLTLAALGCLDETVLVRVVAVDASFGGAVGAGESVTVELRRNEAAKASEIRLFGRGKLLTRVVAREVVPPGTCGQPDVGLDRPMRSVPLDRGSAPSPGEVVAGAYHAARGLADIARSRNAGALAPPLLEALGFASYIVGMEVPGQDGVFAAAKLSLRTGGAGAETVRPGRYALQITEHDPRTERLLVTGSLGPAAGSNLQDRGVAVQSVDVVLECFLRPRLPALDVTLLLPPIARPASGRAAVVIGGSRGFGAAAALALLGRGHETHAVFSSDGGGEDLRRSAGPLAERLVLQQARADQAADGARLAAALTAGGLPVCGIVLAAAPPPLPMGLTASSGPALGDYVATSVRLAAVPLGAVLPLLEDGAFILFCSSSALTAPPRDWPHYVAAKGALEGLARWTAATAPGIRTVIVRLPKLHTGMTNSPTMRVGATPPDAIAGALIERLSGDELRPGLTILEPESL